MDRLVDINELVSERFLIRIDRNTAKYDSYKEIGTFTKKVGKIYGSLTAQEMMGTGRQLRNTYHDVAFPLKVYLPHSLMLEFKKMVTEKNLGISSNGLVREAQKICENVYADLVEEKKNQNGFPTYSMKQASDEHKKEIDDILNKFVEAKLWDTKKLKFNLKDDNETELMLMFRSLEHTFGNYLAKEMLGVGLSMTDEMRN